MAEPLEPPLSPEEKARAKFLEDFAELMGQANFRRFLWHLLEGDGWCETHATGADTKDAHRMYFALGKREIGVHLMQTAMAVGDELYKRMLIEAINLKVQRELRDDGKPRPPADGP